jgi:hypothetical protein
MSPSFAYHLFHAGFLLGLFFDSEDGGNMLLPNMAAFQRITRPYMPQDRILYTVFI